MGEARDALGRNAALLRGPGGGLLDAVLLAENVVAQALPAVAAGREELRVGLLRANELVDHAEHHGAVRSGTRGDPFGPEVLGRVRQERIDRDRLRALGLEGPEVPAAVVQGREPVNVVRDEGIAPPEHDALALLEDDVPARRTRIARADDVGQDAADGGGRVAVDALDEAAAQVEQALLEVDRGVDLARGHPAVGAAEDGARAVLVIDAVDLARDELEGLVPRDADELVLAAALAARRALLEPAFPHHRIADARGRVRQLCEAVDVHRGAVVMLEGRQVHELAALDVPADDAPARGGDHFVLIDRRLAEAEGVRKLELLRVRRRERGLGVMRAALRGGGIAGQNFRGLRDGLNVRDEGGRRSGGAGGEEAATGETGHVLSPL